MFSKGFVEGKVGFGFCELTSEISLVVGLKGPGLVMI